ncbi:Phospholipid-transporting ATPase tat-1 [Caenorhabditis elegans]|uniref:Phospholipid-transporting ATPase tat-1 n=1 Tax=Caenorhabditis elegans TaxID=6239 RepID=TAT1_CAEEL|nr:Phospholipid-transporting ATPase tat-1 [Caenorhabditis elegans]Q9U280.3 RecName: Full=Phospholipid-transporting ATPase tat-1; Short=TAT-1 [Caenorhabditis elegans]CAB11550.4 Phospholipid-transporting ATPase tat-1 [Caenorhabditis elegans]|eukprot:NP_001022894.1 Phospholipid-transporting ATPase tat-1 [Caenorhabditis elegans]
MPTEARDNNRHIHLGKVRDPHHQHAQRFCSNRISTCKYNGFSFLPRFLYEQFRRYNNIFFLAIALLQQIPDVSPTGRYTTAVPFLIILSVSALKEIFEDVKRRRSDNKVNAFSVEILVDGHWIEKQWKDVSVGDFIRIDNDSLFPADLLLLASSEQQGMAYIETSNLDGETNLKIKQALDITSTMTSPEKLSQFESEITCEPPSRHVNEFNGNIEINGVARHFGIDQLLLRGARLKNTAWIFGAVIYTGHDSKLLMNSKRAPLKSGTIDVQTNYRIIFLFFVLVALALISATGSEIWRGNNIPQAWYLSFLEHDPKGSFLWGVLTFFILYNNLIPISLQVTLEVVRFFQAIYINNDIEMYDVNSDSCAIARTSNLNEELGQVKFIMSDKTGTLTRNVMKFKRLSIGSRNYGNNEDDEFADASLIEDYRQGDEHSTSILEVLKMMAVCHTVVPENKDGQLIYQSSSPDEAALVRGAASQSVSFHTRQPQKVICNVFGEDETIEILDVIDFTSDRKRMSVIVRDGAGGDIKLYTKGADTVIFERLEHGKEQEEAVEYCTEHLEDYASFGYRTLCFSMRHLTEQEYSQWAPEYKKAILAIDNRAKLLADAAEKLERNMILVGATAIEDKLQEWVPETIQALMAADIRVWMLTGDKRETAINIAHSCALCHTNTELLIVDKTTYEETYQKLEQFVARAIELEKQEKGFAMVIDGKSLLHALTGEARKHFGDLALRCHAVVCCRMSPMQKAEVVEMVRKLAKHVVLAIGDGANDVAMIQAANVGVGISGEEGLQAASASDYAIPRFHFLRRLLLVHGAWNHDRSVKVILYSFYKNICLYIIELWFAMFSAWSGQTIFERWTIGMFNVIFTAWPPVVLGLFDHPVPAEQIMKYPALYASFQNRAFSIGNFSLWIGLAIVHSLSLFFLTYATMEHQVVWDNGLTGGWLMLGNCAYTFVVATVCFKALLECDSWTWPVVVACIGSIGLWIVFVIVYSLVFPHIGGIGADMAGMAAIMMSSYTFWLALLFIPLATLLWDLVIKSLFTIAMPTPRELAVMYNKRTTSFNGFERLASYSSNVLENMRLLTSSLRGSTTGSTRSRTASEASLALAEQTRYGFAFSQDESSAVAQTELIRNVDSTREKPTGR